MSDNLTHLYENLLPSFYRRDDAGEFLKRFLTAFCGELDAADDAVDSFNLKIAPETAPEEFIEWWLWAFFGWGFFPSWFTLIQKREFYRDLAKHYAQRGTKRGIEEFLAAFGVRATVYNRPVFFHEAAWGEPAWMITEPLGIVVRIYAETAAQAGDQCYYHHAFCGEAIATTVTGNAQQVDIEALLQFEASVGQVLMIESETAG